MFVVMTKVQLREGTKEQCAELFRQTNPGLVEREPDWLGARMLFDSDTNTVTVLASWKSVDAYKAMTAGEEFQNTMQNFGAFFAGKPEITFNEVLVDMAPKSI